VIATRDVTSGITIKIATLSPLGESRSRKELEV